MIIKIINLQINKKICRKICSTDFLLIVFIDLILRKTQISKILQIIQNHSIYDKDKNKVLYYIICRSSQN